MPSQQRANARAAFTLVELLAAILILTTIVTITGILLRETRMTASRLVENEEASHTASGAMELIRHDIERAVANTDFIFAAFDGIVDIDASVQSDDLAVAAGTPAPAAPVGTNGARLFMLVLNENATGSSRAITEVYYRLAANPLSAYPTLVRSERVLDTNLNQGAYTDSCWWTNTTGISREVVARYVTDFSVRCTGRDFIVRRDCVTNELPVCVDVYLEHLPESAARRLQGKGFLTNLVEIERNVTKISARIFPPNRRGYMDGK